MHHICGNLSDQKMSSTLIMYTIRFFKNILGNSIGNAWEYKSHSLALVSGFTAFVMDWFLNGSFMGIAISFLALFFALVIADFVTGVLAAKYKGEQIISGKLSYTFHKLLMYVFFFWLINEVHRLLYPYQGIGKDQAEIVVSLIRYFVFILLTLREFISIGENIEKRFSKKPQIFNIAEKIADLIELKIMKKIEESDICKKDEKRD